jgi:hypothetical protein
MSDLAESILANIIFGNVSSQRDFNYNFTVYLGGGSSSSSSSLFNDAFSATQTI